MKQLTEKDKSALKVGGSFLLVFLCIAIFGLATKVRNGKSSNKSSEVEFTPEQKIVIEEWRKVWSEVRQAREDLEKTKTEIYQLLNEAKATAIGKNIDPNVGVNWLTHGWNGDTNWTTTWIIANGKPVLWGMRHDGLVMWKAQQ